MPTAPTLTRHPSWMKIIRRVGYGLLGIVVVVYVVVSAGVYGFAWSGPKTKTVTRFVPLPVAVIQWRPLGVYTFLGQLTTLNHYSRYLTATNPQTFPVRSQSQNIAAALTKMIRDHGAAQIASRLGLHITASQVDQAYQAQLVQNGNAQQVASTIQQLYQWTPAQFQQYVIRPVVINDQLLAKLSFDPKLNQASLKQAESVLALVKAGQQSFADVAKAYSDDSYGASGGDVGFISQGQEIQEINDAAFSLPLNQVSDLIHTKYGFHILQVTEKKTVNGQDQVHLFEITISGPSVDQYVTSQLKTMSVRVFWPGVRWDANQGQVVSTTAAAKTTNNQTSAASATNQ